MDRSSVKLGGCENGYTTTHPMGAAATALDITITLFLFPDTPTHIRRICRGASVCSPRPRCGQLRTASYPLPLAVEVPTVSRLAWYRKLPRGMFARLASVQQ